MNGKENRFILDTNAIIALLKGNKEMLKCLEEAAWIGISIISKIEFMIFPGLSESDRKLFEKFLARVSVIDLLNDDELLISKITRIRRSYKKVKLPDAIIISTAIVNNCTLVTADKELLKVKEIQTLSFSTV